MGTKTLDDALTKVNMMTADIAKLESFMPELDAYLAHFKAYSVEIKDTFKDEVDKIRIEVEKRKSEVNHTLRDFRKSFAIIGSTITILQSAGVKLTRDVRLAYDAVSAVMTMTSAVMMMKMASGDPFMIASGMTMMAASGAGYVAKVQADAKTRAAEAEAMKVDMKRWELSA